ncbi:TerD family protein [Streptomyces sp. NPDC000618]|uniref:TerD family protein n=1 Tax=Streptomyces sp. NPDC000618 TaxID=3154265 RepID=UPI00332A583F
MCRAAEDFVFYGAPEHPDGTVRLTTDGPTEQAVTADLERLPLEIHRVVVAAAIEGAATFRRVLAVLRFPEGNGWPRALAEGPADAGAAKRLVCGADGTG